MDLKQIREWVVDESGRHDLINADGSNNGMHRLIRSASRWLDRKTEVFNQVARVYRTLAAGEYLVQFQDARTISLVAVYSSSELQCYLERFTLDDLRKEVGEPFGDATRSTPAKYAPVYFRAVDTQAADYSGYEDWIDTISAYNTYNGIIVAPPADQSYLLEVWGKFYSAILNLDKDENYWSANEPFILVLATLRQIEVLNRNRQGVMDWEIAIQSELYGLESDFVEDSITGVDQLEG